MTRQFTRASSRGPSASPHPRRVITLSVHHHMRATNARNQARLHRMERAHERPGGAPQEVQGDVPEQQAASDANRILDWIDSLLTEVSTTEWGRKRAQHVMRRSRYRSSLASPWSPGPTPSPDSLLSRLRRAELQESAAGQRSSPLTLDQVPTRLITADAAQRLSAAAIQPAQEAHRDSNTWAAPLPRPSASADNGVGPSLRQEIVWGDNRSSIW